MFKKDHIIEQMSLNFVNILIWFQFTEFDSVMHTNDDLWEMEVHS